MENVARRTETKAVPADHQMLVVCAWCGCHLGWKPCSAHLHGEVTDSICPKCATERGVDVQSFDVVYRPKSLDQGVDLTPWLIWIAIGMSVGGLGLLAALYFLVWR